ncbi:MAG: hypothetical protein ACRD3N_04780 [Terracidiphilus sp.]
MRYLVETEGAAREAGFESPSLRQHLSVLKAGSADPAEWVRPIPGEPLTFRTTGQEKDVTLKPLNQSWQRFAVYWTVA